MLISLLPCMSLAGAVGAESCVDIQNAAIVIIMLKGWGVIDACANWGKCEPTSRHPQALAAPWACLRLSLQLDCSQSLVSPE